MLKKLIKVIALLAISAPQVSAVERLSLQVVCHLAEHRFRVNLTEDQASQIENDCASELASLLNDKISFLEFVAGGSQANQLEIRIGKTSQEANPNAIRAVNFEVEVTGENVVEQGEPVRWEFRSLAEYLDVPAANTFADAIAMRFARNLETGEDQLVRDQLGRLVIAGSAFPLPADQSWLLPFSREELGIADDSEFLIKAALVFPSSEEHFIYHVILFGDFATSADVPSEFYNKVKALHMGDDKLSQLASIQRLIKATDVRVEYVMISHYVPISRPDRTAPSGLVLGSGGSE